MITRFGCNLFRAATRRTNVAFIERIGDEAYKRPHDEDPRGDEANLSRSSSRGHQRPKRRLFGQRWTVGDHGPSGRCF